MHPAIARLELQEPLNTFLTYREYAQIEPFVARFDRTFGAETVWNLHCHGALGGLKDFAEKMRQIIGVDRKLRIKPSLKENFVNTIQRNIKLFNLNWPGGSLRDFGNWIYDDPKRCPGVRLVYEVWHTVTRNKTVALQFSDMENYQHITCLPYVNYMTVDRRMHNYISQASKSLDLRYQERIFRAPNDLITCMTSGGV